MTEALALLAPSPSAAESEKQAERGLPVEARADEAAKAERGIERLREGLRDCEAPLPYISGAVSRQSEPQIAI